MVFYAHGLGTGHTQSLLLACTLIVIGFVTFVIGMLADVISANRKILEDVQYHIKRHMYDQDIWDQDKKD